MRIGFRTVLLSLVFLAPLSANAAIYEFIGGMNVEQEIAAIPGTVVPDPYFGGGYVSAFLDTESGDFGWEVFYGGLTGPATAAHFHVGAPGVSGGVAVGITVPAASSGAAFGDVVLSGMALDGAIADLTGGGTLGVGDATDWYLNIHTGDNPGGELRGQLFVASVVPVPAAVWMMISAAGVLAGMRRRS